MASRDIDQDDAPLSQKPEVFFFFGLLNTRRTRRTYAHARTHPHARAWVGQRYLLLRRRNQKFLVLMLWLLGHLQRRQLGGGGAFWLDRVS